MPLAAGVRLGPYEIVAPLGAGGMGEVYRAIDTRLNRSVAIKTLPRHLASDAAFVARFEREAQILASLQHPNIATIFGLEHDAIVMELVEGEMLRGPVPTEEAFRIGKQIAEALEAAHDHGVIHRDLKPANVIVKPDGFVKVLDFGLAKISAPVGSDVNSPTLTMTAAEGTIAGTPAYMAPEQAAGKQVDRRADIWAFGVVLYELLTNHRLFQGETASETMAEVLRGPIDLSKLPRETPASVRKLIERCLTRNPRERLRDIGEARIVLENPVMTPPAVDEKRASKVPWLFCAAALAVAAYFGFRQQPADRASEAHRYTLDVEDASVSPDGRWFLNSSRTGIRLRRRDVIDWRTLPGTEMSSQAFWSPDSSTIGFFASGRLKIVSRDGGTLRDITAVEVPGGGAWYGSALTGKLLFSNRGRLHIYDLSRRSEEGLPIPIPAAEHATRPCFFPESDSFLFDAGMHSETASIYRSSLSSPTRIAKVVDAGRQATIARHPHTGKWHLFYLTNNGQIDGMAAMTAQIDALSGIPQSAPQKLLTQVFVLRATARSSERASFSIGADGTAVWRTASAAQTNWRLRWHDHNGNSITNVAGPGQIFHAAASPDGQQVAFASGHPSSDIWVHDKARGSAVRVSTETGIKLGVVWSPDGKFLYYIVLAGDVTKIVRRGVASAAEDAITLDQFAERVTIEDISPDGKFLLIRTAHGLATLSTQPGERARPVTLNYSVDAGRFHLSPDGRLLLFGGRNEVLIWPFPPTGEKPTKLNVVIPGRRFFDASRRFIYGTFLSEDDRWMLGRQSIEYLKNGVRISEPTFLFPFVFPTRGDTTIGAVSSDGNRILLISASYTEPLRPQVSSDWTTLLPQVQ